ncbi:MAG TPA: glycosyltransferase family 4 protein [Solirubrobacteraceae bacterium]|nr:glycosyltransferase family 4 protein [Solirubrobacteraceae bacterium]
MRVLYVSHTANVAGAEHSLLVLLRALSGAVVEPVLACPEGELATAARAIGVDVCAVPGTDLSSRLHPRHTAREAARAARTGRALGVIGRESRADLVHANTPRAGLISAFAGGAGGARPVVHVRDSTPPGRVPGLTLSFLARRASAFVSTSRFLADQLPRGPQAAIVANAVEPDRFDPSVLDRRAARVRLELGESEPVLAVVAQISPHKGQSDAIRALALVRRTHPDARLLLIGSIKFTSAATRYDNHAYGAELDSLIEQLGLGDAVTFLGERSDIPQILAAVDVLLVPSWYEPFGRAAIEAMMMGVPVIATSVGGIKEVISDGVDGLVLDPRNAPAWAQAIVGLIADPERRRAMGARGRRRALRDFSPGRHAEQMLDVYERALRGPGQVARQAGAARYALAPIRSGMPPHD